MLIYYISTTYLFPLEIGKCLKSAVFYPISKNMTPIFNYSVLFIIKNEASLQNFILLGIKLAVLERFKVILVFTGTGFTGKYQQKNGKTSPNHPFLTFHDYLLFSLFFSVIWKPFEPPPPLKRLVSDAPLNRVKLLKHRENTKMLKM
jgi:hypothetical protein